MGIWGLPPIPNLNSIDRNILARLWVLPVTLPPKYVSLILELVKIK